MVAIFALVRIRRTETAEKTIVFTKISQAKIAR